MGGDDGAAAIGMSKNNMTAFGWSRREPEFNEGFFQIFWFDLWQFWHLGKLKWLVDGNLGRGHEIEFRPVCGHGNFILNQAFNVRLNRPANG